MGTIEYSLTISEKQHPLEPRIDSSFQISNIFLIIIIIVATNRIYHHQLFITFLCLN